MAGHSKWANIKHRKAAVDAKRGKLWSKCARAIMAAARHGGPDPASNLSLRYAIDEARYANMPRDTIERAIKKGAGELTGDAYESVRYEGYGPGGVAVVVDALTDNRTRTATNVRGAFSRYGGNLGQTGSVGFQFETRGVVVVLPAGVDGERLMEIAADAGATDIAEPSGGDEPWVVSTEPTSLAQVRDALESAGFKVDDAKVDLVPNVTVSIAGDVARSVLKLIEALEDDDDVQKVYANFEIPDEELASLQ